MQVNEQSSEQSKIEIVRILIVQLTRYYMHAIHERDNELNQCGIYHNTIAPVIGNEYWATIDDYNYADVILLLIEGQIGYCIHHRDYRIVTNPYANGDAVE